MELASVASEHNPLQRMPTFFDTYGDLVIEYTYLEQFQYTNWPSGFFLRPLNPNGARVQNLPICLADLLHVVVLV